MPRRPRSDWPGARQHVMNRTAAGDAPFADPTACALFVDVLGEIPDEFGIEVHGYALLPDRYDLMLVSRGNLARAMRHLGATFTQAWNRVRRTDGPVFRGRYRNAVVDDDDCWMHLLAHLHLAPVRGRPALGPRDHAWSSHRGYVDPRARPRWLHCDALLTRFGSARALERYVQQVRTGARPAPEGFEPDRFGRTSPPPRGTPARPGRDPQAALAEVAALLSVSKKRLLTLPRGRSGNTAAWLAVWWVLRSTSATQTAAGRLWRVSRPRIRQIREQLLRRADEDAEVRGWMEALEELRQARGR